jgi:choline dehydrogenase-like flavoprotein
LDHPAIGRYLRLHPVPIVAARFAEPVEMWRGTMQAVRSLEFLPAAPDRGSFTIESAPGHPGLIALAFPWTSADQHAAMLRRARWYAPLLAICRDEDGGRVRPTRSGGVRIDRPIGGADAQTLRRALVELARVGRAAGAQEMVALGVPGASYGSEGFRPGGEERAFRSFMEQLRRFDFRPNRGAVFSAHQMGTARMGADPRDHACDPRGRVRSGPRPSDPPIEGLYVADGSLFPTGLGINPMVTVMALARRVARTVLAEGRPPRG